MTTPGEQLAIELITALLVRVDEVPDVDPDDDEAMDAELARSPELVTSIRTAREIANSPDDVRLEAIAALGYYAAHALNQIAVADDSLRGLGAMQLWQELLLARARQTP